jgi:hypothetical protein
MSIIATFVLWYLGIHLAYYEFYVVGFYEMQRLFSNAIILSTVVIVLSLLWSYYNVILIKIKGERRQSQVSICFGKDMANLFHIDPEVLEEISNCPAISVAFHQGDISFKKIDLGASQGK